ncbi:MAG: class I SAM-dependent methyltransferase [Akkermansiaceae bacterium]
MQKPDMYEDLEASLHDAFWEAEGGSAESPLLEGFLEKHSGTALELGCGSGRLLLPLLEKGFLIEGLDNSPAMLEMCAEKCVSHQPILHSANIGDFSTSSSYSAITIPAFTLQFISPEELPDVFFNIRNHLHPGGGLYITTFIPWAEITGELEEGEWFLDQEMKHSNGNTARCHTRFQINRMSQRLSREHRYEISDKEDNVIETSNSLHKLNWFWPNELSRFLETAGYKVDKMIGDFDTTEPFDENSHIVTLYCTLDED